MKKGSTFTLAVATILTGLLMFAGCSNGDSPSGSSNSGNLRGRLTASALARAVSGPPVAQSVAAAGAEIILDGVATGFFTDAGGEFALDVPAGTHTISVSLNGVTSAPVTVEMPVGGTVELEVELQPDGTLAVEEDVDHDGDVDSDDDLDHDNDIDDDDDDVIVEGDPQQKD